jgi:hypothetical protein
MSFFLVHMHSLQRIFSIPFGVLQVRDSVAFRFNAPKIRSNSIHMFGYVLCKKFSVLFQFGTNLFFPFGLCLFGVVVCAQIFNYTMKF